MNEYLLPYSIMLDSGLKKLKGYTVYADESNNMRKVRIKDSTKDELKYRYQNDQKRYIWLKSWIPESRKPFIYK